MQLIFFVLHLAQEQMQYWQCFCQEHWSHQEGFLLLCKANIEKRQE